MSMALVPWWVWVVSAAVLGVVLGSFAGLVVYRLPRMVLGERSFNLCYPASHCELCRQPLRWWHNVPVLSYVLLRGRCGFCAARIGRLSLFIELAFGLLWAAGVAWMGPGVPALLWCGFFSVLLVLALIDAQTQLLPDVLTLPLAAAGLLLAATGVAETGLMAAVLGAALGYAVLSLVAWVFGRWRGVLAMGGGDPKLMGALGAWLGWQALLPLLLLASVLHVAYALVLARGARHQPVPYGPPLALAAAVYWLLRHEGWMQQLGGGGAGALG